MKCPNCNEENQDGIKICAKCGKDMEAASMEAELKETDNAETGKASEAEGDKEDLQEGAAPESASQVTSAPEESQVTSEAAPETEGVQTEVQTGINPAPEAPKKKNSSKMLIGGIAAAVIVAGGVFAAVKANAGDPKTVVIDAFKNVYSEETVYPIEEIFGLTELTEYSMKNSTETGFSIKLEGSDDPTLASMAGSGMTIAGRSDIANKKTSADMGFQYGGMDIANVKIYTDVQSLMVGIPELSSKVFLLNYADDLQGQVENSPFLGPMIQGSGVDLTWVSEYMDYIWSFYGTEEETPFDLNALWNRYQEGSKAIEDFKTALVVEKSEAQPFTLDGKEVKCKGYDVTISKDAMISFLRTSSDFFMSDEKLKKDFVEYLSRVVNLSQSMTGGFYDGKTAEEIQSGSWEDARTSINDMIDTLEDSMSDVTMKVYVDKGGRLAAVNAVTVVTDEMDSQYDVKADLTLKGGDYLTQNADLFISVTNDGDEKTISVAKQGTYDKKTLTCDLAVELESDSVAVSGGYTGTYNVEAGDYDMKLSYKDDTNKGSMTIAGVIENLTKGQSFDMVMDTIEFKGNDTISLQLSGDFYMKPLEGELKVPEGEQMDILAASESEWETVIYEIYSKVFQLAMTLQGLQ